MSSGAVGIKTRVCEELSLGPVTCRTSRCYIVARDEACQSRTSICHLLGGKGYWILPICFFSASKSGVGRLAAIPISVSQSYRISKRMLSVEFWSLLRPMFVIASGMASPIPVVFVRWLESPEGLQN
jgi:hypothetical protein